MATIRLEKLLHPQMKVESHLRQILKGDEGLSNPVAFDRLKKVMSEGGDWDSALIRLIDADRREPGLTELAINVLRLRGSYGRPEARSAVISYFKARVIAARAHDRSDPLFVPVVVVGIRSLASGSAKYGDPDLLLTVLEHATSSEEQTDPLLDKYTVEWIVDALLAKGDSRHLEGMRKLLAVTKDVAVKEKLERAIAKVVSEAGESQPKVNSKPSVPRASITPLPAATPLPSTPITKVAERPPPVIERKWPVWPWLAGIITLVVIVALALKCRAQPPRSR